MLRELLLLILSSKIVRMLERANRGLSACRVAIKKVYGVRNCMLLVLEELGEFRELLGHLLWIME